MNKGRLFNRVENIDTTFRLIDILVIILSGLSVYYFRTGELMPSGRFPLFLIIVIFFTINIFSLLSTYRAWRGESIYHEIARVSLGWCLVILAVSTLTFLTKTGQWYSRLWVGWTYVTAYSGLIGYRVVIRMLLHHNRSLGLNQKTVLIVGAGVLGKRACDALLKQKWAGLVPVAFFDDDQNIIGQEHKGVKVEGDIDAVAPFIEAHRSGHGDYGDAIDQVWIALPLTAVKRIEELQNELLDTATNVYFIPDLFGFNLTSYSVHEVVGLPVMNMSASTMDNGKEAVKRFEDIFLSIICITILSPLIVTVAIMIKLESSGPIFFKQRRYGQDGKEFLVWKFRSMTVTEDDNNITQATRNDGRITKIGGWIRKLSIDELPQLINVLNGNMSLIGPRPHAVAHNEFYRKKVSGYMARHRIKPGITGWAQVNGCRGETAKLSDMERRIQYDLEYIRNWSIFLDIRILLMTIKTVVNYKDTY